MHLRPSEIFFSQAEINNTFDKRSDHRGVNIGITLDRLVDGQCRVNNIPTISVKNIDGKWVTADNRRLWVFRHLEKLGKCDTIPVLETYYIDSRKLNSTNGGRTVRFYSGRYPAGVWHTKVNSIDPNTPKVTHDNTRELSTPAFTSQPRSFVSSNVTNTASSTTLYSRQSFISSENQIQLISTALGNIRLFRGINALDPSEIRYTKDSIQLDSHIQNLKNSLSLGNTRTDTINNIIVYKAFKKYWVTDGNRRLWAFKEARKFRTDILIPVILKEDKDEFLEVMRKERPWLSLLDILQSGTHVNVT